MIALLVIGETSLSTCTRAIEVELSSRAPVIALRRYRNGAAMGQIRIFAHSLDALGNALDAIRMRKPFASAEGGLSIGTTPRGDAISIGILDAAGMLRGQASIVRDAELVALAEAHRVASWEACS